MSTAKPVLLKTLDKDAETGLIVESISGEKMVAFRTTTALHMMDTVIGLLGEGLGANLIYQMGKDTGRSMFDHLENEVKSQNDLVNMMDTILAERGWGRCRELKQVDTRGATYYARTEGNPISGRHGTNEPMCHYIRGFYAGFLEGYLKKKVRRSEQVSCRVLGAPSCTFETTLE
jgi:predicted hydrocarbon binding protein